MRRSNSGLSTLRRLTPPARKELRSGFGQRAGAKPSDIFTPAIQEWIRKLLAPEMAGQKGKDTRGSIRDEGPGPGTVKLEVNAICPKGQPLGSMPGNVLTALPPLPEGLDAGSSIAISSFSTCRPISSSISCRRRFPASDSAMRPLTS